MKRPRGRTPVGKQWDTSKGWVDANRQYTPCATQIIKATKVKESVACDGSAYLWQITKSQAGSSSSKRSRAQFEVEALVTYPL